MNVYECIERMKLETRKVSMLFKKRVARLAFCYLTLITVDAV
jgi:hypothetical protein